MNRYAITLLNSELLTGRSVQMLTYVIVFFIPILIFGLSVYLLLKDNLLIEVNPELGQVHIRSGTEDPSSNGMERRPMLKPVKRKLFRSPGFSSPTGSVYNNYDNEYYNQEIRNIELTALSIGQILARVSRLSLEDSSKGSQIQDHLDELFNRLVIKIGIDEVNHTPIPHELQLFQTNYELRTTNAPGDLVPIPPPTKTPEVLGDEVDLPDLWEELPKTENPDQKVDNAIANFEAAKRPLPFKELNESQRVAYLYRDLNCSFQSTDQDSPHAFRAKIYKPIPTRPTSLPIPIPQSSPNHEVKLRIRRPQQSSCTDIDLEDTDEDISSIANTLLNLRSLTPQLDVVQKERLETEVWRKPALKNAYVLKDS